MTGWKACAPFPPPCRTSSIPASPRCAAAGGSRGATARAGLHRPRRGRRARRARLPRRHRASGSEATDAARPAGRRRGISGALADEALTEADLAAGRYDAATIETWLVDWSEPELHVLLGKGVLGEVRREGAAFTAEVRGAGRSAQPGERTALHRDLLGRSRRRALHRRSCASGVSRQRDASRHCRHLDVLAARGLDSFADGWFTAGRLDVFQRRQCRPRGRGEAASRRGAASSSSCGRRCRSRSCRAMRSSSPPAATSALRPAATVSTMPSTSAAFRTSPATTSS